jgi:hypothetical protein
MFVLTLHPYLSGHRAPMQHLEQFVTYIKSKPACGSRRPRTSRGTSRGAIRRIGSRVIAAGCLG